MDYRVGSKGLGDGTCLVDIAEGKRSRRLSCLRTSPRPYDQHLRCVAWYKQNTGVQCQNVLSGTQYSIRMMTMGRGAVGSCVSSSSLVVNPSENRTEGGRTVPNEIVMIAVQRSKSNCFEGKLLQRCSVPCPKRVSASRVFDRSCTLISLLCLAA